MHTERPTLQKAWNTSSESSVVSSLQQPALRRAFHASAPRRREHHFDTLKFVQRLQSEGFTEEQSVAMMKVLNDVIQERYALLFLYFPPCKPVLKLTYLAFSPNLASKT